MKTEPTKIKNTIVVGLGGAGCNIVEYLQKNGIKASFIGISNPERPNLSSDIRFIKFVPPQISLGEGSGKFLPVSDMNQPLILPQNIKELFTSNNKYILLAGLGGYTGTYMVEHLADFLKQTKIEFAVICCLPLQFEGKQRKAVAREAQTKLESHVNVTYFDPNTLSQQYGDRSLEDFFDVCNTKVLDIFKRFAHYNLWRF